MKQKRIWLSLLLSMLLVTISACGAVEMKPENTQAAEVNVGKENVVEHEISGNISEQAQQDIEQNVEEGDIQDEAQVTGPDAEQELSQELDQEAVQGDAAIEEPGHDVAEENHIQLEQDAKEKQSQSVQAETSHALPLVSDAGKLSVKGTTLVDKNGKTVVLRGVSTHGIAWFPEFVNKNAFQTLRDTWGVNCIRIAMYTAEYGGYCTVDAAGKNRLKQMVLDAAKQCKELSMYVIVDWHILSDNTPTTNQSEAIAFFDEMSQKLAGYDNVLYEICNEPNGGTDWNTIKSYALKVIPAIRANAPDAIIIVGTPTWSQDVDQAVRNPIGEYDNIMYTLHFYADTHRDSLRNKLEAAVKAGLPIFVSEFGLCDASGNGQINAQESAKWMDLLVKYNVSSCIWALSNKNETCSLIRSDCNKTSGWTEKDLSESGKWFYRWMVEHGGALGSGQGGTLDLSKENQSDVHAEDVQTTPSGHTSAAAELGEVTVKAEIVNTWETEGKAYAQCNITITNSGNAAISDWTVSISAEQGVTVSQGWCCKWTENGTVITLTPESYNKDIAVSETKGDIGIILESNTPIQSLAVNGDVR